MQTASDNNPNVNVISVFLDISKTSDKFWHNGFIFKFKSYGVEGELLSLLSLLKLVHKELLYMIKHVDGETLILGLHKDQYWDHFCFWFI